MSDPAATLVAHAAAAVESRRADLENASSAYAGMGADKIPDEIKWRFARRQRIALDLETHLIGPGAVFPKPVCATFAWIEDGKPVSRIVASGDPGWSTWLGDLLSWLEADHSRRVVAHYGHSFDWPVLVVWFPEYTTRIFDALERGQIQDTVTREKLLNLARHGVVDYYFTPDGEAKDISYQIHSIGAKYLGIDRSRQKGLDENGEQARRDAWRLNFAMLDGYPASAFPKDASDYAQEDARDCAVIAYGQDLKAWAEFTSRDARGHDGGPFDVFRTEPLHVGAMVMLGLATLEGFGVDPAVVAHMEVEVAKALREEQTYLLYDSPEKDKEGKPLRRGIKTRALPVRPYANGARHGKPGAKPCTCAAPSHEQGEPKMCHPEPEHTSNILLRELVVKTWVANRLCDEDKCPRFNQECADHGLPPLKKTEPSDTFPEGQISCDSEVIADLAPFNPILAQYDHYTIVGKLQTLEIPRLKEALANGGTIHPGFEEFKKTGRTSSRRSKFYPSINIQQIPRGMEVDELGPDFKPITDANGKKKIIRLEPRHAYVSRRPGWVLVSIDYSFIELVTLAQQTKRVIGYSVLLDKINKGFDPHAFLGAQLAVGLEQDFAAACQAFGHHDADSVYKFFVSLKAGSKDQKAFYKTWRQFAKPVGLGFPGGLGARTFIVYAKKLYNIVVKSIEQAKSFKEVWANTFPENREYLNRYVRDHLRDEAHSTADRERFSYFSPLGAYRSRCSFTEVANGFALQTPAAEGMKLAVWKVQRACWDQTMRSPLYGCRVVAAIHDELLISMPEDAYMHERAFEASRLWIEGMNLICPEALVQAEPAAMRRWDKGAECVRSRSDRRLRVWEPDAKYEVDEEGKLWVS